jgi:hypothetical protein
MHIELFEPMPTRPARVCLSLELGSVFADFDVDPGSGCLYLVRISFDGYGCCQAPAAIGRMSHEDSRALIEMADRRVVDPGAEPILRKYLTDNERLLWSDALREYDLV